MKVSNKLQLLAVLSCLATVAVTPVEARTKQGDKLFKLGVKAEGAKEYDRALDYYGQALSLDPKDPGYLLAEQRTRTEVSNWHVQQGKKLLSQQKLDDALVEFERALLADPSSQIALQEIRQTTDMVKARAQTPKGTPVLTPAEQAQQELEKRISSLEGPPQLRPINDQIRSLKMNNQAVRVLYESVGKLAGVNVLFDPQGIEGVGGKNFNLDLNNVTLEEALGYIALETHTFWKPISRNAIFITQESEPKRQEYQDEVVKVFYVQNATSQAEFTEIFNAVRVGAKLNTGIFQVASQNAIVARGSVDAISLVEKLVHDLDKSKPEVMVDIIVMEVNKSRTRTLGAALLGQGGLSTGINFTPRTSITTPGTGTTTTGTGTTTTTTTTTPTTTPGAISIGSLGHLSSGDFSVSLPGALLQAMLSDTSAKILQRPQVRATDGGKASLKIGSKIPYVSGSLNSAVATPGAIPYATTQFQQVEVGVLIDMSPHVNGPNDVSMKIKVEISNTAGNVDIAGVSEPIITQRINEADLRMKDGEPTILGGLSDIEDNSSASGIPGIVDIPVLGYLFGTKKSVKSDDQILVALIPHIIRAPDQSAAGQRGVLAGTERVIRVERKRDGLPISPMSSTEGLRDGPPPSASAPARQTPPQGTVPLQPNDNGQPIENQGQNGLIESQPGTPEQPDPNEQQVQPQL